MFRARKTRQEKRLEEKWNALDAGAAGPVAGPVDGGEEADGEDTDEAADLEEGSDDQTDCTTYHLQPKKRKTEDEVNASTSGSEAEADVDDCTTYHAQPKKRKTEDEANASTSKAGKPADNTHEPPADRDTHMQPVENCQEGNSRAHEPNANGAQASEIGTGGKSCVLLLRPPQLKRFPCRCDNSTSNTSRDLL